MADKGTVYYDSSDDPAYRVPRATSSWRTVISSAFVPELDEESCTPCSRCADRCPMHAIELDEANGSVFMDHDTCIGCGVCVTPCIQDAISLTQRPAAA